MDVKENIYRTNGFRILGLDITTKGRKIDNRITRIDRYKQRKNFSDTEPLKGVFDKSNMNFLLPVSPEPSYNEYQDAKNRLTNVKTRMIDEIFWFWPKSFDSDLDEEVADYLKENNFNKAISYWGDTSTSGTMNMTSIHNLAVLYHVRALDGFMDGKGNKKLFEDLDLALNYWNQTVNSSNFKNYVKQRVNDINDPRLTEEYIDEIFENLPFALLNINYLFIKKILRSSNIGKRKLDYVSKFIDNISDSPFDESDKSKVSSKIVNALDELVNQNKNSFEKSFESAEDIKDKFNLLFEYSDEVLPYLSVLSTSLKGDTYANNLLNSTCYLLYNKIPAQSELVLLKIIDEDNFNKFLDLLKKLREYATDSDLVGRISSDINTFESFGGSLTLNFSIVDEDGARLSNVDVILTNSDTGSVNYLETDDYGECSIKDLSEGEYSYTARKIGYVAYEGKVTLSDGMKLEKLTLKKEGKTSKSTASVNISVKSSSGERIVATVSLTNVETGKHYEKVTDLSGDCTINDLPLGIYRYEVDKLGYEKYTGTITVRDNRPNLLIVKLNEEKTSTPTSYNKKYAIFVVIVMLLSLAYYAGVNFL